MKVCSKGRAATSTNIVSVGMSRFHASRVSRTDERIFAGEEPVHVAVQPAPKQAAEQQYDRRRPDRVDEQGKIGRVVVPSPRC